MEAAAQAALHGRCAARRLRCCDLVHRHVHSPRPARTRLLDRPDLPEGWCRCGRSSRPRPETQRAAPVGEAAPRPPGLFSPSSRGHPSCAQLRDPAHLYLGQGRAGLGEGARTLPTRHQPHTRHVAAFHGPQVYEGAFAPLNAPACESRRVHRPVTVRRSSDPCPDVTRPRRCALPRSRFETGTAIAAAGREWGGPGRAPQAGVSVRRALSSGLTTLPVGLRGSDSTKTNWRGTL